jgi:S1-C subfamily serine protease
MPEKPAYRIPPELAPDPGDYSFDLDEALRSVVSLSATVPGDAFTADVLGTERGGSGVLIRDRGVVLTIGYIITEADTIWLSTNDGQVVGGTVLGYDQETGFGLVQALGRLNIPAMPLGHSSAASLGTRVIAAAGGGRDHAVAARVVARQEFAGYWEYVLEDALYTTPAHPFWGGTALIGPEGQLLGIGSLQLQHGRQDGSQVPLNMFVPIDALKPVLNDLLTIGRPNRPARPWLGLYATEIDDTIVIAGLAGKGPAAKARLQTGDIVVAVAGKKVTALADLFKGIWRQGDAGVNIPLTIVRDGKPMDVTVASADRNRFLKGPSLH